VHVLATAGHVDHGKSTLVLALTGMDPDRFAEEKARGMTIDLGFAWTTLPSGRELAFVDVPGHVRFIKNMLAGVGAVDACLFVVDAAEGWKPQSEEHLRILGLLGVGQGVVALTKADLVDEEWLELARLDLPDRVGSTFLEGAEVVAVDGVSGRGLDELGAALDRLLERTPTAVDRGRPRLWVDRSFAAKGSGTVVTGTLTGGALSVDDELALVPGHRTGRHQRVRVRALQSHRHPRPQVGPGHRVAVNLTGVSHDRVARGDALVRAGQWHTTRTIDCSLTVLASLEHEVSRRGAYHAYIGSGEHPVRLRLLGTDALGPGEAGKARIHLPVALPLLPGDRYVLRESGRAETVGGGEVLDVDPVLPASKAAPDRSTDRVVAERGWVEVQVLERLTGERRAANVGGRWVVSADLLASTRDELARAVAAAGRLGLDVAGLDERQRAVLATMQDVAVSGGRALPGGSAATPADAVGPHPFVAALEASPFAPPDPDAAGVDRRELRELVRRGAVVERDGCYFAPAAVDAAARVTVAEVRQDLGTTRKYLLPLLGHLDATGVTRRRGEVRVAGPKLPSVHQ
jgi:selenocysteine-specific elongation factor